VVLFSLFFYALKDHIILFLSFIIVDPDIVTPSVHLFFRDNCYINVVQFLEKECFLIINFFVFFFKF